MKIEYTRARKTRQSHQGLQEACGESALPYTTLARWVKAFNEGHQNVADMRRPGRPSVSEEEVYALSALLESDHRHTIRELARETGLAHMTVLHILKERLGMSRWVPHDLTGMQKWLRYDAARNHLQRYEREGEAFLRRIITLHETLSKSYEPQMKRQSNEWRPKIKSSSEERSGDAFCRTHPSFCRTMLGRMQRKLWLICSIDGDGKCCTIHRTPRT
ncbi:hypothetical protein B7P43_G07028 [Cryptotermes secundus]|uniref:Mos1 transposase HTH domain-containing protein n=1 Tax=Cryptotermes secundus TaxID=105785 RepID=A0A2J7PER3_9NEOP|nr:hypothetical protein B7P43_G07028 [Cryptotermes secundus]